MGTIGARMDEHLTQANEAMDRARRIQELTGTARFTIWATIITLVWLFGRSLVPVPDFVPHEGEDRVPGFVRDLAIYLGVSVLTLMILMGNFALVAIWTLKARRNLDLIGAGGLSWSPAWAAGGWLIPFANLVIPFLVLLEVWKASNPDALLPDGWSTTRVPKWMWFWWAFWVAGSLLFFVTEIGVVLASLVARVPLVLQFEVRQASHLLLIIAAGFWIHLVRRVTANQIEQSGAVAPTYELVDKKKRPYRHR